MRWIKVRAEVVEDPAVMRIGELLGLDTPSVLGRLVLVWLWADAQTVDGVLAGVTPAMLDRVAQREGFAKAMHEAGWLRARTPEEGGGLELPNFLRHNGSSAKARALGAIRQTIASQRATPAGTHAPRVSREEKKREEKNINQSRIARPPQPSPGGPAGGAATPNPTPNPTLPTQNPAPTDHDRGVGTSPELAGVDPRDRLRVLRELVLAERARASGASQRTNQNNLS